MKAKRWGWWALAVAAALLAGTAVMAASDEKKEKQKQDRVWVFTDGSARLGVTIRDVDAEKTRELKLPGETGVLVEEVEEDSPAAKAGLQKDDVILTFAEERVRSVAQLKRLLRETPPGRTVAVQVSRGGRTQTLQVTPEARQAGVLSIPDFDVEVPRIEIPPVPPMPPMVVAPQFDFRWMSPGPRLGVAVDDLTPQLAEFFSVKQGRGVLVREVSAGSAAAKAGLRAGDVIVKVDDEEIGDVSDLRRALRRERKTNDVTLTIVRERKEQTVKVTLEEPARESPRRVAQALADQAEWQQPQDELGREQAELRADYEQELQELRQELGGEAGAFREQFNAEKLRAGQEKLQQELRKAFQSEEFKKEMERLQQELRKMRNATERELQQAFAEKRRI